MALSQAVEYAYDATYAIQKGAKQLIAQLNAEPYYRELVQDKISCFATTRFEYELFSLDYTFKIAFLPKKETMLNVI